MKNWVRIFLISFISVGGTALFTFWTLERLNKTLDGLFESLLALSNTPPVFIYQVDRSHFLTAAVSKNSPQKEEFSVIFPPKDGKVYAGCTYKISFFSSLTPQFVEIVLVNADLGEVVEQTISGLAKENKIESGLESLDWKVGAVTPGDYYLKVLKFNEVELEKYSSVFEISKMPKGATNSKKEELCGEAGGLYQ